MLLSHVYYCHSFYETYVFDKCKPCDVVDCECGMPMPESFHAIEGVRMATRRTANETHATMVAKYVALAKKEAGPK